MKKQTLIIAITATLAVLAIGAPLLVSPSKSPTVDLGMPLDADLGIQDVSAATDLKLRPPENHPVTNEMSQAASSLTAKRASDFMLIDTNGTGYRSTDLWKDKPVLIFFIEKECPCCLGAKHFFDKMADLYEGSVNAIGIINADDKEAQKWVAATQPRFPVLQDPRQQVISAFKAERGVYTTLVKPGGEIEIAYPGYSLEMLKDLSRRIALLANVPEKEFKSDAAPQELTSGCLFPEPDQESNNQEN